MDVNVKIKRAWKKDGYTIGRLFVNGTRLCESLEDKDRGMTSAWTDAAIKATKIAGETAIPTGTYKLILSRSNRFSGRPWAEKFSGLVPEIVGVKGYAGVRIHPANDATELEGCIAPGDNKVKGGVINSVARYTELMKYLYPAWIAGVDMFITIE